MSSSTAERMDEIVRAAKKIVKAAKAGDADKVLEHAIAIEGPLKRILDDSTYDWWNDRSTTELGLDAWSADRTRGSTESN